MRHLTFPLLHGIAWAQRARLDAYAPPLHQTPPHFGIEEPQPSGVLIPPRFDWAEEGEKHETPERGSTSWYHPGGYAGPTSYSVERNSAGRAVPVERAPHKPNPMPSPDVDPAATRTHRIWNIARLARRSKASRVDWSDGVDLGPEDPNSGGWPSGLPPEPRLDWPEPAAAPRPLPPNGRTATMHEPWDPPPLEQAAPQPREGARSAAPVEVAAAEAPAGAAAGATEFDEETEWGAPALRRQGDDDDDHSGPPAAPPPQSSPPAAVPPTSTPAPLAASGASSPPPAARRASGDEEWE